KEDPGERPEEGMVFAGLVGMLDPPKPGVKEALAQCHRAGIRTVMITGDHPVTARAIAEQLDLSRELRLTKDPSEIADVYARISPEDKLRIVRALKETGEIAAMTGDGVNDAPALKAADIGIAMGAGADVAKEAAAMILVDNNFQSIVRAVEEGRIIDENIRKATLFLLTCSFSLLGIISGAIVLDLGLPLLPLQILWLNLLIHVFPALGLALAPGDGHELERAPRPPSEPILSRPAIRRIAVGSLLVIGLSLGLLAMGGSRSAILVFVAFMLVAHSFSMQAETMLPRPAPALLGSAAIVLALQGAAIHWQPLRSVLGTRPLTGSEWTLVLLLIGIGLLLDELSKPLLKPHA
ncbi:MAG: HAD-IC family P-type ATPase, partial [Bacteroidota bacterium]